MNKYQRIAQLTGSLIDPVTLERMVNDERYTMAQIAAVAGTKPDMLAKLLLEVTDTPAPVVTIA